MLQRRFEWPMTGAQAPVAAILTAFLTNPTNADGLAPSSIHPAFARQARCDGIGDGLAAPKASDECLRINGYVAAGADFAPERSGGLGAPFGPLASPGVVTTVGRPARTFVTAPSRTGGVLMHASEDDIAR